MDTYITTVHKGKGYTAIIHKPILTPEERARRLKEVEKALVEFAIERERVRANA